MTTPVRIIQEPAAGVRALYFRGDQVVFRIKVQPSVSGSAFVRTNLGHGRAIRREIIDQVERNISLCAKPVRIDSKPQSA